MEKILLCYKNFSKETAVSHVGLGITALYSSKTLNQNGYLALALPIFGADDLTTYIVAQEKTANPVSHALIMAQWIATNSLSKMVRQFPHIKFAVKCHSNIAFLQAEPPAINLIREAIDLEAGVSNFFFACNNKRLSRSLQNMYGSPVTYLPNLYYTHGQEQVNRPLWNGGVLKIGCFGSLRVYKNFSTAVSAGIELTQSLKCSSEIWINGGRNDGTGNVVYNTAEAWTKNLPNVTLKTLQWASWADFKRNLNSMNILMQPSFTETFNNVTADGICQGTPSVVGESIEWCPNAWKAEPDDASQVASIARQLLFDPYAAREGYAALQDYVQLGLPHWKRFLS